MTTTSSPFVWPLPATRLPNAHLTWSAYQAWQAAHLCDSPPPASTLSVDMDMPADSIRYLASSPSPHFAWPLPATQLPHAYLSWADWIAHQAARLNGRQPVRMQPDRAA